MIDAYISTPLAMLTQAGWMYVFLVIIGGLIIGAFLGAMPGITATVAVALMFPPSIYMPSLLGIIFLSSIYTGGVYGGGVMSIALNIPGSGAAVATTFDGYPMTQKGLYFQAVGYGLMSSVIGCLAAYIAIFFLLVPIGLFALKFGPPEIMMIAIFAFSIIGFVTGNMLKSLIGGFTGLLLGTVGSNSLAQPRGILGFFELLDGLPFVVTLIGLFAISEAFFLMFKESIVQKGVGDEVLHKKFDVQGIMEGFKGVFRYPVTLIRSMIIGLGIGIVPAAGSTIASIISYGQAQSNAKNPKEFGTGCPEGVVAAETANNSSEAGAMATMLCFGIPGSSATAVLMGAFMVHGLLPGPYLVRDHMDFAYAVIISNFIQGILLVLVGLFLIYSIGRIIAIPTKILVPMIIATSVLGAFAARQIYLDVFIVLIFGIIGYMMRKYDYSSLAMVLGLILSGIMENEFFRTYSLYSGRFEKLFLRPIFDLLLIVTIVSLFYPVIKRYVEQRKKTSE